MQLRLRRPAAIAAGAALAIGTVVAADAATTQSVSIKNFAFQPKSVTAPMGGAVRWTNNDITTHTTTSKITGPLGWNQTLGRGGAYAKTLTAAGGYRYLCTIHPTTMTGSVAVPIALTQAPGTITVKVATVAAPTGYSYQAEVKVPGSSTWMKLAATTKPSVAYHPKQTGTFSFRSSVKHGTSVGTTPSPVKTITVS